MVAPTLERPARPAAYLPAANCSAVPAGFAWTEAEQQKLAVLARHLNCGPETTRQLLVFFLRYIHERQRGLAVAHLPEVLADFPVKWGYKKKRNDFLKLLHQMDFIYVKINFRPKVRAKTYALARSGLDLIERLGRHPAALPLPPRPVVGGFAGGEGHSLSF